MREKEKKVRKSDGSQRFACGNVFFFFTKENKSTLKNWQNVIEASPLFLWWFPWGEQSEAEEEIFHDNEMSTEEQTQLWWHQLVAWLQPRVLIVFIEKGNGGRRILRKKRRTNLTADTIREKKQWLQESTLRIYFWCVYRNLQRWCWYHCQPAQMTS